MNISYKYFRKTIQNVHHKIKENKKENFGMCPTTRSKRVKPFKLCLTEISGIGHQYNNMRTSSLKCVCYLYLKFKTLTVSKV